MGIFGYESVRDMFDGGGRGQSGDRFEGGGVLSDAANAAGFTPVSPGPGSGSVYQGPNIDGSSGYVQDPGQMTVNTSTGAITSDNNTFTPAPPPPPPQPQFDITAYLANQEDPPLSVFLPPAAGPVAPTAPTDPEVDPNAPVSMNLLPPNLAMLLRSDVEINPETMFTFEDYLAQLNRQGGGVMPPAIQSLMGPSVPPLMSAQPAAMPAMAQMPPAPAQINPLVPMPTLSLQGIGSLTSTQPALANIASRVI